MPIFGARAGSSSRRTGIGSSSRTLERCSCRIEQILKGGVSECRNKTLQDDVFAAGLWREGAGSGFDKIRQGWASQKWRLAIIEETFRPDRVRLVLPMVSLLPEESVERIKGRFGTKFKKLLPLEVQALVTADLEGGVSNLRMRQICSEHPAELTKLLQELGEPGVLAAGWPGRGTTYRLRRGTPHRRGLLTQGRLLTQAARGLLT